MSACRRLSAVLLLGWCALAQAQQYPVKPIHIVVGFAAGGPTEVAAC